jgi:predicted nucleotidyltransferase
MSAREDMLLRNYLEKLLDSTVAIRLVKALIAYPGRIFTVRKLSDAAGTSASEAAVAVHNLERHGIVKVQPVGRAFLVSLNHQSYIVNTILKPIISAEQQTVAELASTLRDHLKDRSIISASLFGSIPRGEARDDSDIDLFVISDNFEAANAAISNASSAVASIFNGRLSPLIMSRKELSGKSRSRLVASILENYTHIAGRDLKELVDHK